MAAREENVYSRRGKIGSFSNDFIHRPGPELDDDYWRERVVHAVAKHAASPDSPLHGVWLDGDDEEADYDGWRFYLNDVTKGVPEVTRVLRAELPGCRVMHEMCANVRDRNTHALVSRFRTWVLVTHAMQRSLERRRAFRRCVGEHCRPVDICILLTCIAMAALFFTLLDRHWEGYESPWRNLALARHQLTALVAPAAPDVPPSMAPAPAPGPTNLAP